MIRGVHICLLLFVPILASCSLLYHFDRDLASDADAEDAADSDIDVSSDGDIDADADLEDDADAELADGDLDADRCAPGCSEENCAFDGCGQRCSFTLCGSERVCTSAGICQFPAQRQMVLVAPGTFVMGSPTEETEGLGDCCSDEQQHTVTLTRDFLISSTEVTQDEYADYDLVHESRHNDSSVEYPCTSSCPVDNVTWNQAAAYANFLSRNHSPPLEECYTESTVSPGSLHLSPEFHSPYDCHGYRLPTEAEWEYAARAGTVEATYACNIDGDPELCPEESCIYDIASTECTARGQSLEVSELLPNDWGLFDMLGNASEWVHDYYNRYPTSPVEDPVGQSLLEPDPNAGARICRGGAGSLGRHRARAAYRSAEQPDRSHGFSGFRLARTVTASTF